MLAILDRVLFFHPRLRCLHAAVIGRRWEVLPENFIDPLLTGWRVVAVHVHWALREFFMVSKKLVEGILMFLLASSFLWLRLLLLVLLGPTNCVWPGPI